MASAVAFACASAAFQPQALIHPPASRVELAKLARAGVPLAGLPGGLTEDAVWEYDTDGLDGLVSDLSADETPSSQRLLAIALARRGDIAKSEATARLALSEDADDASMLFLIGLAAEKRDDLEEAVDAYAEVLETDPDAWRAHFHLAKLFLNVGLIEGAATHLQSTLKVKPDFAPAAAAMKKLEGIDVAAVQATFDESLLEDMYGDGPGLPEPAPSFDLSSLGDVIQVEPEK